MYQINSNSLIYTLTQFQIKYDLFQIHLKLLQKSCDFEITYCLANITMEEHRRLPNRKYQTNNKTFNRNYAK